MTGRRTIRSQSNAELFLQRLVSPTSGGLFRAFDSLKTVGMLGEIRECH